MELIYLSYNQYFKPINEIVFSTNLSFREELFSFIIEENKSLVIDNNFFGDKISNITAFIGKNGTGKTSNICKPIMAINWLTFDFVVFKKEGELLVFKNPLKESVSIENKTKYLHKEITISDLGPNDQNVDIYAKTNNELKDYIRLYYSASFSETAFDTKSTFDNISTSGLISKELAIINGDEKYIKSDEKIETKDSFSNFKFNELKNQIDFLESTIGKELTSELNMNSKIEVSYFPRFAKNYNFGLEEIELFSEIFKQIESLKNNGLVDITNFPGAPRIVLIVWSFLHSMSSTEIQKEFVLFLQRKNINFYENKIDFDKGDINLKVHIGELVELLNSYIQHFDNHYILKQNSNLVITKNVFSIPVEISKNFIDIYYKAHKENITKFNFQWSISAGEYSFLSLFSRLYGSTYRAFKKHYLIIVDEGDSNFHPEWSRKYLKLLIEWIPKILSEAKSIQLVLTTHSPYVLSDLPASNVYILKKEKGKLKIENSKNSTFGANIHDLLANDFFLEEGFIGEFAKEKIQNVIDLLNTNDLDKRKKINQKEIWNTIEIIGEPFLKEKLKSMFLSKFKNPEFLKIELDRARAEVERLENLNK
jgi:predicted ATP-binding protein involved in virulence